MVTWCDRMESAVEGHTDTVCEGEATHRVEYTEGNGAAWFHWVQHLCGACADAVQKRAGVYEVEVTHLASRWDLGK